MLRFMVAGGFYSTFRERAARIRYGVRRLDAVLDCVGSGFGCQARRSLGRGAGGRCSCHTRPEPTWSRTASSRRTPYLLFACGAAGANVI